LGGHIVTCLLSSMSDTVMSSKFFPSQFHLLFDDWRLTPESHFSIIHTIGKNIIFLVCYRWRGALEITAFRLVLNVCQMVSIRLKEKHDGPSNP
jgi:hypothetical protein